MSSSYHATIVFQSGAERARVSLAYAPSVGAVQAFCNALHPLTGADIPSFSFTQATDIDVLGDRADLFDVSYCARFQLKNAAGKFAYFDLPAPHLDIFEHLPTVGYRVLASYGATVAAAYSALLGEAYTFVKGWLIGGS